MDFDLPTDPSTAENYNLWRKDVVIWQKLTCVPKAKQGLALQYACKSNIQIHEAIVSIDTNQVEGDNGFNYVLKVLDTLHNYDENFEEVKLYDRFQGLKREDGQPVADILNQFDFLLKKLLNYGNKFNDTTLAEKLMKAVNLTATQREIIKASTIKFDYASVKATIKRTFPNMTEIPNVCDNISNRSIANIDSRQMFMQTSPPKNLVNGHQSGCQEKSVDRIYKHHKIADATLVKNVMKINLDNKSTETYLLKRSKHHDDYVNFSKCNNPANRINVENGISNSCYICLNVSEKPQFPLVKLPVCSNFNELIVMDIKSISDALLLNIIDVHTLYSVTAVLKNNNSNEIMHCFYKYWIDVFGPPLEIVTPNGGYIVTDKLKLYCSSGEICFSITSSEDTWCSRLCEENSQEISDSINKILSQTKCSLNMAVTWAVNVKNCSKRLCGYTPAQLIFGFNPVLPSVKENKPPMLSRNKYITLLDEHLEVQKSARKLFVNAEISGIHRRRLSNTPSHSQGVLKYFQGDKVMFKRKYENIWEGPAIVISHDDDFVLISHNNSWILTHAYHLLLFEDADVKIPPYIDRQEKGVCLNDLYTCDEKVDMSLINDDHPECLESWAENHDIKISTEQDNIPILERQKQIRESKTEGFLPSYDIRMKQNNFRYTVSVIILLSIALCLRIFKLIFNFTSICVHNIKYILKSDKIQDEYFYLYTKLKSRWKLKRFAEQCHSKIELYCKNQEESESLNKDNCENLRKRKLQLLQYGYNFPKKRKGGVGEFYFYTSKEKKKSKSLFEQHILQVKPIKDRKEDRILGSYESSKVFDKSKLESWNNKLSVKNKKRGLCEVYFKESKKGGVCGTYFKESKKGGVCGTDN